jgi:hypothetical protein
VLHGERLPIGEGLPDGLVDPRTVLRVDPFQVGAVRERFRPLLDAEDAVELVRPRDRVASDVPFPAADVRDGLRLAQASRRLRKGVAPGFTLCERGSKDEKADDDDGEERLRKLDAFGHGVPAERDRPVDGSPRAECTDEERR